MRFAFIAVFLIKLSPLAAQRLPLSTQSDSALFYYYEGWRQVMDEGNYTLSEKCYRKMVNYDPDFLVGMSLLGRIITDLNERLKIENQLKQNKQSVNGDERTLLDVYIGLVELTNLRASNPDLAKRKADSLFTASEKALRTIVHRYPDELYYKSEYIEVLNHNHGPTVALDSLSFLTTVEQRNSPFLLGYTAHLLAELKKFDQAMQKVRELEKIFDGKNSPKPHAVLGDIYFKMGELDESETEIEKALEIDPGNIDAQRLKKMINEVGTESK